MYVVQILTNGIILLCAWVTASLQLIDENTEYGIIEFLIEDQVGSLVKEMDVRTLYNCMGN